MTRSEKDHERYILHREERLKKQREYYVQHRDYYINYRRKRCELEIIKLKERDGAEMETNITFKNGANNIYNK